MIEQLEPRQLMAAQIAENLIRVRMVSSGGLMINQSVVRIPTTERVDISDPSKIQVRGYAFNTLNPSTQQKINIKVLDAKVIEHNADESGMIELTLDRMMRKGGRIYFYEGALTDRSDGVALEGDQIVRSPQGLNKERFTLACRAFIPTDRNLFQPFIYTGATAAVDASNDPSDATVTADLTAFLNNKVADGTITADEATGALNLYNSAEQRSRVPNHNLRAAIVSLVGTVAEHSINTFLGTENVTGRPYTFIGFADTGDRAVIADTTVTSKGRLEVRFKPGFNGEHFAALSAFLAHESIHQDEIFVVEEEVIGNVIQEIVYAQQLDADPSIAAEGTNMVKLLNTYQLAMLNSGRTLFPVVGILDAPLINTGRGVFPLGRIIPDGRYTSHGNFHARQYLARGGANGTSPGNPTLDRYLAQFDNVAAGQAFSDQLISDLDNSIYPVMTNALAIRTASTLKLAIF